MVNVIDLSLSFKISHPIRSFQKLRMFLLQTASLDFVLLITQACLAFRHPKFLKTPDVVFYIHHNNTIYTNLWQLIYCMLPAFVHCIKSVQLL